MLVLGDLACPDAGRAKKLISDIRNNDLFGDQIILCNLEGIIRDDEPYKDEKLFNHPDVLNAFEANKTVFSLANNHTYDYPEEIENTEKRLNGKGFLCNGINHEGIVPALIQEGSDTYAIFTHCWKTYTKTNPNRINGQRITDCSYREFFETVKKYIQNNPEKKVICYFHWNYDMETLPFPSHRKLAHALIDAGAFSVIGNHSHVPQGGEIYKGHAIIYGLGNFYIPSGCFFNGNLVYPDQSKKMMVLEIPENSEEILCHWFMTDQNGCLSPIKTEKLSDGDIINEYSPYRNMDDKQYLDYFRKNRVKRTLVPVFRNYYGFSYSMNEFASILRIRIIKAIKH